MFGDVWLPKTNTKDFVTISLMVKIRRILYLVPNIGLAVMQCPGVITTLSLHILVTRTVWRCHSLCGATLFGGGNPFGLEKAKHD